MENDLERAKEGLYRASLLPQVTIEEQKIKKDICDHWEREYKITKYMMNLK